MNTNSKILNHINLTPMKKTIFTLLVSMILLNSCKDEVPLIPVAFFKYAVDPSDPFTVSFTNASKNVSVNSVSWDFGDGSPVSTELAPLHRYAAIDSTYAVTLTVNGSIKATDKKVTVATPCINTATNLIKGGSMAASCAEFWTITTLDSNPRTAFEFKGGGLKISDPDGDYVNGAIWQKIEVPQAGDYKLLANVKGAAGYQMWYQYHFRTAPPEAGKGFDANNPKKFNFEITWWGGCGIAPFNGDIATVSCSGTNKDNGTGSVITFPTAGTYYFIIVAGVFQGTFGPAGFITKNISLTKI
jgi:hypothetical protein